MLQRTVLIAGLLLLSALSLRAAELPVPSIPSDDELEKSGAVIGDVAIRVQDIFDPEDPREDHRLYRWADRLHRDTRDSVIASQLLFKPGDRYSRRVLDESERILRQNRYLYDVQIRPVRWNGNRVDVEVVTRDVWTLNAGVGIGRSGGVTSTSFKVQDTNLLGTGKSLTLVRQSDVDRNSTLFRYDDPGMLGSRVRMSLSWSDNSDGSLKYVDVTRPFYAMDTRWSAGLTALEDDRVDPLYVLGHATDRFRHQVDRFELRGGLSHGLVDGWARRWSTGFTFQRDRFEAAAGLPAPSLLPEDRTLSYPWVALDILEDDFLKAKDLDQIHRTEDFEVGSQLHLLLGWSSPLFGGDRDAAVFDGLAGTGFRLTPRQTLLLSSELSGRWGSSGAENLLLHGSARYYWRDFGDHLLFATLEGDAGRRLDPERQILLGGDSGLRGYPLRYQDGDARALLTLEQRFFTDIYPLRLFHVGGAVFFDIGRTWAGESGLAPNYEWLRDVGVGLRLSPSRSGLANVVHIDLAFPLDGDGSIQRMQWLVRTKASF